MARATVTATLWQEDGTCVALCPELGVSSCGGTPDEALEALKEAVELFLENAHALGTWDDVEAAVGCEPRLTTTIEVATPRALFRRLRRGGS